MTSSPSGRRVAGSVARRAHQFVQEGREPVLARPASTVLLIRDTSSGSGIEVYIHRRHRGMAFAAGVVAFPGGGVDPGDAEVPLHDVATWMQRLGVDDEAPARAHVAAAVRELAEETGVVADPAELAPWARWITPTFEERRFDTWFFLLPLPAGLSPEDVSGETEGVAWVRPADELARADAGESVVMPPTRAMLTELADFGTVADAVTATTDRHIVTVQPDWELDGADVILITGGGG